MKLELSDGKILENPDEKSISDAVSQVANGMDHCILSDGDSFVQTAASGGGLLVQYRDFSGMYDSVRTDLDSETVTALFLGFHARRDDWKDSVSFQPQDGGGSAEEDRMGGNRVLTAEKPFSESLKNSIQREAVNGLSRTVRRVIRRFFRNIF